MALDQTNLFFIERREMNYRLRTVPTAGGNAVVLAAGNFSKGITQVAQDAENIYLLNGGEEILVQRKPAPPAPPPTPM